MEKRLRKPTDKKVLDFHPHCERKIPYQTEVNETESVLKN